MEPKKNPNVDLEKKRGLYMQIGLAVALLVVLGAFEYRSYEKGTSSLGDFNLEADWEEEIENTQLNRDEENELEQIEEEVAKEASSSSDENHNENGDTSRRNERGGERLSEEEIREETTKFWESITGQPEGKEKDLIDKIVDAHSLNSTPMDGFLMENADSECGPSGPFALLTLWNSVDDFKRQRIIDFFPKLNSFLLGRGYTSFDSLIRDIDSGKIGGRKRGEIRTLRALEEAGQAPRVPDFDPSATIN